MGRTTSRGEEFWARHIEQYRHGGLSLREYCERHGLKLSTFGRWRRRVCHNGAAATTPAAEINIVRVDVEPVVAAACAPLEVVLDNGRCIRVSNDFDPGTLARVVSTLERLS